MLAAINEIETDYGRNLSVSSANAVGWMQFLPSTWKTWGVDANGDGVADPYNPADAIFAAARYLEAAGAAKSLSGSIYAYNHATWYVQSVLLRAKLIGGMPSQLITALSGMVQGYFPVAAKARYADDNVDQQAKHKVHGSNAAIPVDSNPGSQQTAIYAKQGSEAVAVNDGKIVKVGDAPKLGKFVELQDQTGNTYTYAQLGSIPQNYAVPKTLGAGAGSVSNQAVASSVASPNQPATAGQQNVTPAAVSSAKATSEAQKTTRLPQTTSTTNSQTTPAVAAVVKERLFAYPDRAASYAAGGKIQLRDAAASISDFGNYFSDAMHLGRNQYSLAPLKAGAIVIAGTVLGRLGPGSGKQGPRLQFMIQPAGKNAPYIDAKPILDGWKLLGATNVYRANGPNPFYGPGAKNPTIGQILLMSKQQLQTRVLEDRYVKIYPCGRRDIQAGLIDRRVLATLEFLSTSGLHPTVSSLECGGNDAASATGSSVKISAINKTTVQGHTSKGSITDKTVRQLLTLQGGMKPNEIISKLTYKGQDNTMSLPGDANTIQVTFTPLFGANKKLSNDVKTLLGPGEWQQLINRISAIPEPVVPVAPSRYAIRTSG